MIRSLRVWLVLVATASAAAGPYAAGDRVAHLDAAIEYLRALGGDGRTAFERELHDGVRTACRSITTSCMIDVARRACAGKPAGCLAAADVVQTNAHAESDLVDEPTRVRLVRTSADYHAAIVRELAARQALLAAELALAPRSGAESIDSLCVRRDLAVHRCAPNARGCVPSLPYQRCAAGLAWFVATDGAP